MKTLFAMALFASLTAPIALADTLVNPMGLTGLCKRLGLIEVTAIETVSSKVSGGIESREVIITAEVVEVIRGDYSGPKFQFSAEKYRITNEEEAAKSVRAEDLRLFRNGVPHQASSCRVGTRYLLISPDHPDIDDVDFFYEIRKGRENWRDWVEPLHPEVRLEAGRSTQPAPGDSDEIWDQFYSRPDGEGAAGKRSIIENLMSGGAEMVPAICAAVRDRKMQRRRYAISALGSSGDRRAILTLETIYADSTEDPFDRGEALDALYRIDQMLGRLYAKAVFARGYREDHFLRTKAEQILNSGRGEP